MQFRSIFGTIIVVGIIAVQTGCWTVVAVGGAVGSVAYVKGDLEAVVDGSPKAVTNAAKSALEDMDLHVLESASGGLDGRIIARTSQDKKVTINVKKLSDSTSKLSIRVGTFGDESLSQAIYNRIKKNLE